MIDGSNNNDQNHQNVENKISEVLNDVKDETNTFTQKDVYDGKIMAFLSYCGPFALVPLLTEDKNPFVKFHSKIGINILVIELITELISFFSFMDIFKVVLNVILLLCVLLSILGIINVLNGKAKELPIINKIHIIK